MLSEGYEILKSISRSEGQREEEVRVTSTFTHLAATTAEAVLGRSRVGDVNSDRHRARDRVSDPHCTEDHSHKNLSGLFENEMAPQSGR
jgi:hypothetical protein